MREKLDSVVVERRVDLIIANCENSAAGFGVTSEIVRTLLESGIDVLTSGNHIWDKKDGSALLDEEPRLLRPANYPDAPGSGVYVGHSHGGVPYAAINLQGRTYLPAINCPFRTAEALLAEIDAEVKVRFLDFHAEVTSEKQAMGWFLDGKVSAVVGTHTHVPTADERVLPGGTAYQTDAGMTGPYESVIGMEREGSLKRFLTGINSRLQPAKGDVRLCGVVVEVDERTGRALSIERVMVGED